MVNSTNHTLSQTADCQPSPKEGSAVGVPKTYWFVAVVKNNTELSCQTRLSQIGFESFVASQDERVLKPTGGKGTRTKILIPCMVFVRCTEQERLERIVRLPFIFRFLTDRTLRNGRSNSPVAKIPSNQIEQLRFMLGQSDIPVTFDANALKNGDLVRVRRGKLKGLVGTVETLNDEKYNLVVRIDLLGGAKAQIDLSDIEQYKS